MDKHFLRILKKELPTMVSEGLIDNDSAQRIESFYGTSEIGSAKNTVLTIIGSLAALLIGSGIILLFAYNWHTIPTAVKTTVSFIPLIAGQVLVYYSRIKDKSPAWVEFSSILLALAVGSVIALISQIYQIPGDLGNFLLLWMLLILPLNYLTGSTGTLIIYLTGILFWCAYSQAADRHAIWYWLLFAAMLPRQIQLMKSERSSNRTGIVSWMMIINLLIGTGISLEKVLPGLWILIYSLLIILCGLLGRALYPDGTEGIHNPYRIVGAAGTVILSYLFTFQFFWEEIGLDDLRFSMGYFKEAAYFDYAFFFLLFLIILYLLIVNLKKEELKLQIPYLLLFPLTLISYIQGSISEVPVLQTSLFNAYTFFLGGWLIAGGIRESRLYKLNLGMLTVLLIIVTRFFDMEISFTVKGIIFIILGIIFLIVNRIMGRRFDSE